ncbi:PREDICTED: protein yellow-like [Eufriesea mexicana]|uniref:protein yellow-like n=1 Tax=Eufriesea mexicana TaxID=516756 RepID=UPI00083BBB53|nr:PREDICTED: protein yellow-like [Eufriesea mexicana]XP_017755160.1 PREDICTED: protein yellow-like [Eufriesea mexicana]
MRRFYTTILLLLAIVGARGQDKLKKIYSWKTLEFDFPSEQTKLSAIKNGIFIPGASIPIDVDVHITASKTTVFVSIPRFQNGVPVTLGYVTGRVSADGNHLIAPYPSWVYNNIDNCDSITSVYRMQIDQCERLWVLDTGKLGEKRLCSPKLHVFSLRDNSLITMYRFPRSQLKGDSLHVTIAVDVRDTANKCKDTFAYIADVTGFTLIVYDFHNSVSWMITNNLFYPYPQYGTFDIKGDTFDLMDGIIGLALGPVRNGDRILYFHSLASRVEAWVPTSVIRNYTLFRDNPEAAARSFVPFAQERTSQSAAQAMDSNGVLFFGLMSDLAIACWNSKHFLEYGGKNNEIIAKDPETLQFPSGIKIVLSQDGKQELWVLTASFQRYASGTLHPNETNFRIQAGFVDELVRGTKCDVVSLNGRYPISQ